MTETQTRMCRNKNKAAYRWLFIIFVSCLVVYFWLFVGQALNQSTASVIFCFLFLIAGSTILGWRMHQEPDFEADVSASGQPEDEPG